MGNYFSINLESVYKRNQDFIQTVETSTMERQIQLMVQWEERQKALEIARNREFTNWLTAFTVTATAGLFTGFRRTKRAYLLMPLVPLAFTTLYYLDLSYGNKLHRIRNEAEYILNHHKDMTLLPLGPPTPSSLDQGRIEAEEEVKIHPHQI